MNRMYEHVIVSRMEPQKKLQWDQPVQRRNNKRIWKQLPKVATIAAAVSLCIGTVVYAVRPEQASAVLSHLTAGFEYDETLGRLQYVANILPDSAMVFLDTNSAFDAASIVTSNAHPAHTWSEEEPWLEYSVVGDVLSCADGEIMTVVQNSSDTYTIRVMHDHGYESVYSGLTGVIAKEGDSVFQGEQLGTAKGNAAFELRRDGLSVQPVFRSI